MVIIQKTGFRAQNHWLPTMIIMCILLSFNSSVSVAGSVCLSQSTQRYLHSETGESDGYIIQFNEEPLSLFIQRIKNKLRELLSVLEENLSAKLLRPYIVMQKDKLLSQHILAKQDIKRIIDDEYPTEKIFSRTYTTVFNGLTIIDASSSAVEKIKELSYVKNVYPNHRLRICLDESSPLIYADKVWDLHDAYSRNVTGKNVTVAILDTGVDYTHSDLSDSYIEGYDFVNNDNDPMDDHGHGTHVAGIAIGSGKESNYRYVGIAPDAKFYAYKILNESGCGNLSMYIAGIEKAIDPNGDYDCSDHVDIVSISAGYTYGNPDDLFSIIADTAVDLGIMVVAAAGNNGPASGTIASPGCSRKVLCVGATTKNDEIYYKSSRGPTSIGTVKPDIVAPGVDIISTKLGGGYTSMRGTSMAVPHVTGTIALMKQMHPEWTSEEIKWVLQETADDLLYEVNTQGHGRINALNAATVQNQLFIEAPDIIQERQGFTVNITNFNRTPIKAWVLFLIPLHPPQVKYGPSVWFKAPPIITNQKDKVVAKIVVLKIIENYTLTIKDIMIVNTR